MRHNSSAKTAILTGVIRARGMPFDAVTSQDGSLTALVPTDSERPHRRVERRSPLGSAMESTPDQRHILAAAIDDWNRSRWPGIDDQPELLLDQGRLPGHEDQAPRDAAFADFNEADFEAIGVVPHKMASFRSQRTA